MEGPSLLDRIDKEKAIIAGPTPNSFTWDSTLFGKLTVTKLRDDSELSVYEVEFDNMAYQQQMYSMYPDWFDVPNPSSRWRQKVVLTPTGKCPRGTFDVKPAKGRAVQDQSKG